MLSRFHSRIERALAAVGEVRAAGVYHYAHVLSSASGPSVRIGERELVNFISNNYLGFSLHPKVKEAARAAIAKYGTGMCGSPLACGTTELHVALAERLARWYDVEAALVFPTGYQALLGAVSGMVGSGDTVVLDSLAHRSIIDGARLSGATLRTFAHNDMADLGEVLARTRTSERRLIAVDSVYSMEGDLADLPGLDRLAHEHEAALLIDEAHALGVIGEHGHGLLEHWHLPQAADVIAGTFSKFGGAVGGFVAGTRQVVDTIKHTASPFIFSAAMPPGLCAGVLAAFEVFEEEPQWHAALLDNTRLLIRELKAAGFNLGATQTPVVPIVVGDAQLALAFNHQAFALGVFASPVLPPVVPPGRALLRLGVMARHTRPELERAVAALKTAAERVGLLPEPRALAAE